MIKGLIAGIKTLSLAFLLLFAVIYVISGFATLAIGGSLRGKLEDEDYIDLSRYFHNIPATMFTCFRCFNGECATWRSPLGHPFIAQGHANINGMGRWVLHLEAIVDSPALAGD